MKWLKKQNIMFILKWKKPLGRIYKCGKVGQYLANTSTDSSKSIKKASIFFTKRDITSNEGNVYDSLLMARSARWQDYFELIELDVKPKI